MLRKTRKILVTYALPYANGSLHLGHLVGFIQTDIWVRFQKMRGTDCLFICGCDGHGTPIMIQAEKLNIPPEQLVEQFRAEHKQDIEGFLVALDNYHTTHSDENQKLVSAIFQKHVEKGNIEKRAIKQAYDPLKKIFLPDRYIKGDCPRCNAKDQYGDNCEVCSATYTPSELRNAYSTLSGTKPIEKESDHYFFKLNHYTQFLKDWTRHGHLQEQVTNKLDEWFKVGLQDWDISRDSPYFGFKIPGENDKYFYCWLDAPVGYIASFENFCVTHPHYSFKKYWEENSKVELYHFIGKDILYFHTLFWPAVLNGAEYRMPTAIFCHGFLTINGLKMSKSRGTFIKAKTYLAHLNPEYFRYYLASKLNDQVEDLDINFDDFCTRVNSDLIGKFINIGSRCASFIHKHFEGKLAKKLSDPELFHLFSKEGESIAEKFEKREFSQAIRQIMALADRANQYIDEHKPWVSVKDPALQHTTLDTCTMGINLFRLLAIYLKPILPAIAIKIENFLNITPLQWTDKNHALLNHTIQVFQPLALRLEKLQIDAMKNTAQENESKAC
jgi:methionyl-tRNA synthetase